ncbi:transglutaminase domain-containing protein [Terrimesophilobacter mesophilus]|uniref:Transglutaminase domain-containing protein n=2 Tax=Terrimesophilobacter mesophilus TaxID=433647 RepID=A0A4V3I9W6_9MICO|nr:transglutaminaseTgpA domain-containing protein [Terrimesophilobacter mesophilus]TFB80898.1 transglutaminase domain-containing protein [Terrimesophilobacter mesophilus]
MLALSTAIASLALWPSYGSASLLVLIAVTFAAAAAIAILGAVFRWSSPVVLVITVVAYLALGVPLAVPDLAVSRVFPSFAGLQELLVGAATSWKQLLTISLPVGSYQALLIPAFILILVTVVVSLSVALRSRFGDLAVLGPIVVFVVGILFGPESAQWPFPVAMGLTASILVWLIWSRWYRRRESIRLISDREVTADGQPVQKVADGGFVGVRTLVSAGLILAIAGTASFAASRILPPTNDRVVLRTTITQPFDPRDYASPLSGFRKYELPELKSRTMFTVTGLPVGARIRLATLDSYDGVVYSVGQGSVNSASGAFTRVPLSVDQSGVAGTAKTIAVTIGNYSGVWLPTLGKLERVAFTGGDATTLLGNFYFNTNTDTAAVVGGLSSGDSYSLSAVIPTQPAEDQLSQLEPAPVDLPASTSVPDELATTLEGYVAGVSGPGARLVAMLDGLRRDGYVSHGVSATEPPSRSGHAADRITELLSAQQMIGDQEQYAVTAALMARQLGFPARVVFGFEPSDANPDGQTVVVGGDVSAWIEVSTTRYGWVAIDPTPQVRPIPEAQPEDPTQVARPQSPVQPQLPEIDSKDTQLPPNSSQDQEPLENPLLATVLRVLTGLGWASLVMLVLLSPFLTIVFAKWRRRRLRRQAPTPLQRIEGGWDEFEDAVLDHGFTPGPAPTRLEIAQAVGGTQPFVLAAVADRAVFAPGDPDLEQADQLWKSVDDLRYSLDYNLTRWERIKSLVSLRSLGGYSVSSLFKREGGDR